MPFSLANALTDGRFVSNAQDVEEIADEAKKVMRGSLTLPLWVEISLKTADGERMVLENWTINCNRYI